MIKILAARFLGDFKIELEFSSGETGVYDGRELLKRDGVLLDPLRDEAYFQRFLVDAGALAWPNGLELAPGRLRERTEVLYTA